jgi:hypothetical protein
VPQDRLKPVLSVAEGTGLRTVFLALLFCLLSLPSVSSLAAVIQATPERDPARVGESFDLTFSSDESPDGDPDFGPLEKDFEILGQSRNSQVSIVNGKMSNRQKWTLRLVPKRAGSLPLPSIAFGDDRSQAGAIAVLDAAAPAPSAEENPDILLEVDAEPKEPYFQAQTIYTVRVLHRLNLLGGNLPDPVIDDARVERLGEDRRSSAMRGGSRYAALERKYALFPQKSGLLRLPPMKLDAQVETGARTFFSRDVRVVRVQSPALDLKVRPIPAAFTGSRWLPAASLKLEESWSREPPRVKAGEPLTRTLSLRAQGATAGMLPELGAHERLDASIKPYPDQPALNEDKQANGIVGARQEKIALIPGKAGEFKLPALEIPWWNTQTDRMEIAKLPERALSVEASGEPAPASPPASRAIEPESAPSVAPNVQTPPAAAPLTANLWFWLALLFGAGWLSTILAWLWRSRNASARAPAKTESPSTAPDERAARRALQQACARDDAPSARGALLTWAQARWPAAAPVSLTDAARMGGEDLAIAIAGMNRALYGADAAAWRGEELWQAVSACPPERKAAKAVELTPLYP